MKHIFLYTGKEKLPVVVNHEKLIGFGLVNLKDIIGPSSLLSDCIYIFKAIWTSWKEMDHPGNN